VETDTKPSTPIDVTEGAKGAFIFVIRIAGQFAAFIQPAANVLLLLEICPGQFRTFSGGFNPPRCHSKQPRIAHARIPGASTFNSSFRLLFFIASGI